MVIKRSSVEFFILVSLFALSFLNTATLALFLISLLFLFKQQAVGALKIINLIALRTIISPGLAIGIGQFELIKMAILMIASFYLITFYKGIKEQYKARLTVPMILIIIFSLYNIITGIFISSLPIVSVAKLLFYSVVFVGVLIGVAYVIEKTDIYGWLQKWFKLILFASILTIPFPIGYLRNETAFQGIINHPNMFGIFTALIIAILLGRKLKFNDIFFIISGVTMILLSNSRTALISVVVILSVYLIMKYVRRVTYLKMATASFVGVIIIIVYQPVSDFITEFMLKGQTSDDILYSRGNQINTLLYQFQQKPLLGNGFSVPVLNFRSFEFSTSFIVEPGNLILAVLSFSGVLGFLIFAGYLIAILLSNRNNLLTNLHLFIAPIIISMGEMVFFSSNSIAPILYMTFAMYMFYDKKTITQTSLQ